MASESAFSREVEKLDRQRDRSLSWFLGSFLLWTLYAIGSMYAMLIPEKPGLWVLGSVFVLSMGVWVFFLGRYLWIQSRIRMDPRLAETLNDELVRIAWLRAMSAGFWAMLAAEVLFTIWRMAVNLLVGLGLIPLNPVVFVDIRAPLVLAVGVGVTIGVYLHQRREH